MAPPCEKCKRNAPGIRVNGMCGPCRAEDDTARELRHRAYILAGTKRDSDAARAGAIKAHEDAAVAFALMRLARLHGIG